MEKVNEKILSVYKNKRVLVTGHTGFKGTWFSRMLMALGADVYGIGLDEGNDKIFALTGTEKEMKSKILDIRDLEKLTKHIEEIQPEVIFHLAAQPLVLESYETPVQTFNTNVMGSIHIMEACRKLKKLRSLVMITTDKVYHNNEWYYPYRETDALGGHDPYSASKAACEIAISSYRNSFFHEVGSTPITSVRAGNVIGGGDFAANRIIPDIVRSIQNKTRLELRSPHSVRPWQHVMDVLWGYLLVGSHHLSVGNTSSQSYNIAPLDNSDKHTVAYVTETFIKHLGSGSYEVVSNANMKHEMSKLRLDPSLIQADLKWTPCFNTDEALIQTALEYKAFIEKPQDLKNILDISITTYLTRRGK